MTRFGLYVKCILPVTPVPASNVPDNVPITDRVPASLAGLKFGIGLTAGYDLSGKRRINKAEVVNGIVRVDEDSRANAGLVVESHYFFTPKSSFGSAPAGHWGHGPFLALDASTNGSVAFSSYGLGWMIGFQQPQFAQDHSDAVVKYTSLPSWNLGIGLKLNTNAQVLGDGVHVNQRVPDGEGIVRMKTEPKIGLMVVSSFSFY